MNLVSKSLLLLGALSFSCLAMARAPVDKAMFAKYDANGDGYHDLREYMSTVDDSFQEWDLDQDGEVTAAEMGEATLPPGSPRDHLLSIGRGIVAQCDRNVDGKCVKEEVRQYSRETLFPMMDANKDGRISEEEALRLQDPPAE